MSFGQQSGPPASAKQLAYLISLIQQTGHPDLRSARHEFGLTQRQAGGKFSTSEAAALIERLLDDEPTEPVQQVPRPSKDSATSIDPHAEILRGIPAQVLADELVRRGWIVVESL